VVLRVDSFGNLMTNFTAADLPPAALEAGRIKLQAGGKTVEQLVRTFSQGTAGVPVALVGSTGYVEIAVNKGNAARILGINRGAEVMLDLS
jgi:S-adenosylmethionine hydrolase